MSTTLSQSSAATTTPPPVNKQRGLMRDGRRRSWVSIVVMVVLALLWTLPTVALFISSFRSRDAVTSSGWWTVFTDLINQGWTMDNYAGVLDGSNMGMGFINTLAVSIPATVLPVMFAAFAAYAFTFTYFPLKETLFVIIVALMVVPNQVALQPLLNVFGPYGLGISGQFVAVWLLHAGFAMPLCISTLRTYMATLPGSIVESAKIDGASHFQTFWRLVAPMSMPAIAAFATLQFLWVWNDLLIAKLFLLPSNSTVIVQLQQLLGTQGQGAELLTAGAFITMIVPILVFVGLQRFLVRGMAAGAVKG